MRDYKRIINRFLWFPMILENELRWFTCACIEQTYTTYVVNNRYEYYWKSIKWCDGK